MKHIVRFTSIALILLFAGASTLVRTSERMRIEAASWNPTSSTEHLSPTSPANLQGAPESQAATESTTEYNKALVLKWSDALRNKGMATAQGLVTDDWFIHGAGSNFARGPEGLKQWQGYIDAMWANPHWAEADDIFAEGDKVIRRTTVYRTWRANNKESAMTVVFVYRIADGKIAEVWRVADALTSYQQIGAQIIMPGTNVDVGQPTSLPARTQKVAEVKSSSEQKTSQSSKVVGKNTLEREMPSEGTNERNKTLVARWADAIWNKDLAVAQALVTDDWVIHGAGSSYPKGPEGVKQWQGAVDSNWNYFGSMTDDGIAEGDKVARRTTVFAAYKPNHRSTVTSVVFVYRIADAKIAEVWRVANYVSTYMQAGARIIMPGAKADAGHATSAKTEAEQEVLKAKQEFDEAALRNDADGRARFYSDDYVIVYNDGTLGDKAKQLERVRSGRLRYSARTAEDVIVRVYGDTAVVIEQRKQTATFDGQPRPSDARATEVWVKREGKWQLVSTQITPILEPVPGPSLPGRAAGQTPGTENSANDPVRAETGAKIPNGANQAEQEVLKVSQESDDAIRRNDADALSRIFADDYLFVGYSGHLSNKEYQVEAIRTGFFKFSALTSENLIVRVYGNMAVVIRHRKQVASVAGRNTSGPGGSTRTGVWVKRQGRWQLVCAQVTPILEPAPAPMGVNNASVPGGTPDDEAAIRKIVADGTDAWNRSDAKTLLAHLAENADHINVAGKWGSGKDRIEKGMTDLFATHRPASLTRPIEKIRFITPEVAILVIRNKYANDKKAWEAISISVFHKMNGEWWNEAFQNTLIQSREEAIAQAARASSPMAQTKPEVITPANSKTDFSGDVAAIRKMVADSVDAWNRRDPKAETAHGSENHDHINVIGAWRQGKTETEKAMTAALATTRNNISRSITKIRFITPDVAIVIVRNEYTNDKETLKSISTSVLHKMNGDWNEAFQNTYVQPSTDQASDKKGSDEGAEQAVRALDEQFEDAYRREDLSSRQEMTAEDYIGIGVSGTVFTKTTAHDFFKSGHVKTLGHEVIDRKIRVYGDTAVVTGTRHIRDTLDGKPRDEQHRYTRVWVKRNGQWQVVSFQATKITGP